MNVGNLSGTLSLDQAPPLPVPMRFFLTAPLFGVAAGLLLAVGEPAAGGPAMASRWAPAVLALTHLLVVGFVVPVMFGAMQQMLPVVAGSPIAHPRAVSLVIYALWIPGAAALAAGLRLTSPSLLAAAGALLLLGALVFLGAAARSLLRPPARTETVTAMRLSVASFAIAVALGVTLAGGYAGLWPLWRIPLTNLHLAWALLGWIGLLILGVSYQVVPMFQMTPPYPAAARRLLAPSLFTLIALRTAAGLGSGPLFPALTILVELGIAATLVLFAAVTLRVQSQRRRKLSDPTLTLFRAAMAGLGAAVASHLAGALGLVGGDGPALLAGLLYLLGFVTPVVIGMLYKIVPFLVWFHLQGLSTQRIQAGLPPLKLPTMKDAIPRRYVTAQLVCCAVALPLALLAPFAPSWLARIGGAAVAACFACLEVALWVGWRSFQVHARRHAAGPDATNTAIAK